MKIVIDGNDGLGKSTLVRMLGELGIEAVDRGTATKMTDDGGLVPPEDEFTVILDAPVWVSQKRLVMAGKDLSERYHNQADLKHYKTQFRHVAKRLGDRCVLIDASGNPGQVLMRTISALRDRKLIEK